MKLNIIKYPLHLNMEHNNLDVMDANGFIVATIHYHLNLGNVPNELVKAANNYPKAVELLKSLAALPGSNVYNFLKSIEDEKS